MSNKIIYIILSAILLFSCSGLFKENINGIYYQMNADNTASSDSYFDFKNDGTYQLKSNAFLGVPVSLVGRFEVDHKKDLIYLFNSTGGIDTLSILNGSIIFGSDVFKKVTIITNPAKVGAEKTTDSISQNIEQPKTSDSVISQSNSTATKEQTITETPYGDVNPRQNNDKALQDLNNSSFKRLGINPPVDAIRNDWNKVPIETRTYNLDKDEIEEKRQENVNPNNTVYKIIKYSNGKYEGEWKDDNLNGQGTFTNTNGDIYKGHWVDGIKEGQGTATWANGEKYIGEWEDNKRNGQGTNTYSNGDEYEGDYVNNLKEGHGTFTWTDGKKYIGEWEDDKRNGQGTVTFANSEKYVGQWKDDNYNGQGTYTWTYGDIYEGNFVNGLREGQGTYTWANGKKDIGEWKDDKMVRNNSVDPAARMANIMSGKKK